MLTKEESVMRCYSQFKWTVPGVFLLGTALITGCKLDLTGVAGGSTGLENISLTGPSTVQVGDTIRLSASGSPTGLIGFLLLDPIRDGQFTVSDATIAAIVPLIPPPGDTTSVASVRVQGLKVGSVQVTVSARGKSATHPVEVTPASTP
jgi:hypothetical protein